MLHVHEAGNSEAPAILFVHAVATSGWMWTQQLPYLSDFHCIVPDLPGHGESQATPWVSLEATVNELVHVIRHYAPNQKVHVVGLSLGSYVALELMSRASDLVNRAILSGLNVLPLPNAALMSAFGVIMLPFIKTEPMIRMNAKALRVPSDQYDGYRRAARQMSRRAFFRASGEAGTYRLPQNTATIPCPTLLLAGENEHPLIRQSLVKTQATLPTAEARIAPAVGHGWNGEKPALFAQAIRAWITDQPLPAELLPVQ